MMNESQWRQGVAEFRGSQCYVVDWSVVIWRLCVSTGVTHFLVGRSSQGEGILFWEQVERINNGLLLCGDGEESMGE